MEQLTIQASKIKCGGCVSNIETGLKDFAGITEIKVDVESNTVSIQGNELDKEVIENKLAELGYPAV
ncbi:MAG: heavy-metal-associated domain-containing protein [Gammaproteobacteria bacterium]|nr:heavy-metal-associated domain-containing protein [Gammaproteobacteria bacterium]MCW8988332.1 heavy-metal-associated domain-containing protein [Gammaproteobacteria bacterium]MCW9032123.1 heavy-metal-associated domain-containing protein [Gammaproteobacteria bacterium]